MSTKALAGIRVLEYADLVSGPYCSKLLADLGAEVIKIEEPAIGDPSRRRGPFLHDQSELSLTFLYLNTNKKGITLNLKSAEDRETLAKLIQTADLLIHDKSARTAKELGLDFEALRKLNPRLVVTAVTPFGQSGPYAEYKAYPLNTAHCSLFGYLMPYGSPFPEREPLKYGSLIGEFSCGLSASVGTLAAIYDQKQTGLGQFVDLSKQEAMLDLARVWASHYANTGMITTRTDRINGTSVLVPCKDGHVVLSAHEDHHWKGLLHIMGNPKWAQDKAFDSLIERSKRFYTEILPRICEWAKDQAKDDFYHNGQEANCPVASVMSAKDIAESGQYNARGFFVEIDHPSGSKIKYPGASSIFSETPFKIERSAPSLGEHNKSIGSMIRNSKKLDASCDPIETGKRLRPLEGIRVADFTWAWAGPHAVGLLARLGAEVIKVESRTRIDHSRVLSLTTGDIYSGIDNSPVFSDLNVNKIGITLNLGHPKGAQLAREIARISDVAVQNMRPGVIDRLGLGYEVLHKINPRLVMLSISALGMTGPAKKYIGYAPSFGALGGSSYITGYPDHEPLLSLGESDLLAGTTGAFAIIAALIHRQKTGEGQHIDLSCSEAISVLLGNVLMDYTMNGRVQFRQGNEDECMAPHNGYRCKGEDKWISIAIGTEEEWQAFCQIIGHPEWILDQRFANAQARRQNHLELDKMVAGWTVKQNAYEAMEMLQKAGVAAIPIWNGKELYEDSHLRERDFFIEVPHPGLGKHTVIAPPWKLSRTPARVTRHGPLLGEHNQYVFGELLGLSNSEIENLAAEKAIY
ncbi:MAG: CoA transferase [Dehalococcoidia bacterium]|nr:CoA transferase [Dehalococcoidia bacterium]